MSPESLGKRLVMADLILKAYIALAITIIIVILLTTGD